MTVAVARGVLTRIRQDPGGITLVVKGAANQEAATEALRAAAAEISGIDGTCSSAPGLSPGDTNTPKYVSEVLPTGLGPMVMIDGGHVPYHRLRTIPDIVVRHLQAAGVEEAVVACPPEGGPLGEMLQQRDPSPRIVTLELYPPPPVRQGQRVGIPLAWLDEAAKWVGEGLAATETAIANVVAVEFPLATDAVARFLAQVGGAGANATVVSGELGQRIRGTGAFFIPEVPRLHLAGGGPAATDDELIDTFHGLVKVARRVAPLAGYASIGFNPTWIITAPRIWSEWKLAGGESADLVSYICDQYVTDGYPYQVLGPGHVELLGGLPAGVSALEGNRVELSIGDPSQWLIDVPAERWPAGRAGDISLLLMEGVAEFRCDPAIQDHARQVLAPCLLRAGEGDQMVRARWAGHGHLPLP